MSGAAPPPAGGPWTAEARLLAEVTSVVADADDPAAALASTARAVRRHCGFAVAHVLVPDDDGALVTSDVWDADPAQPDFLERVLAATAGERFAPRRGLPGEVAATHLALWLPDLTLAADYPRRSQVPRGSAWAFPVLSGVEVLAVVEFVDPHPHRADERLLQLAASVGRLLGRALSWKRRLDEGEVERRRLERLLVQRAAEADDARRAARAEEDGRAAYLAFLAHDAALAVRRDDTVSGGEALARLVAAADDGGRRAARRSPVTPADVVRRTVRRGHASRAAETPARSDVVASLDADLLLAAIDALVDDAACAGTGPVEVAADAAGDRLVVEVRDAAGRSREPGPVALEGAAGPAQAARAARALGGSLRVAVREGTSVARLEVPARWSGLVVRRSARVLLVDDHEVNRRLGAAMLARLGLAADVVDGGLAALEAMRATAYDVVLLDVAMPDLDGREVARRWRESAGGATSPSVPIVALTAHAGDAERSTCLAAGMDDHLGKPYGIEALGVTTRRWLDRAQADAVASR